MNPFDYGVFTVSKATLISIYRRKSTLFSSFLLPIIFIWVIWWITPETLLEVKLFSGDISYETMLDVHLVTGALNAVAITAGLFGFLITFENRKISDRLRVAGFSSITVSLGGFFALTLVLLSSAFIAGLLTVYLYLPEDLIGFGLSLFLITLIYGALGHILGVIYPRILEGTLIILLFSFIDLMMLTNPLGRAVYLMKWTYILPGFWPMQVLLQSSFVGFKYNIIWMSLLSILYLIIIMSLIQSKPFFSYVWTKIKSVLPKQQFASRGLIEITSASWKNIARERSAMVMIIFFPVLFVLIAGITSPEGTYPLVLNEKMINPEPTFKEITIILYSLTAIAFVSSIVSFFLSFQMKKVLPRFQVLGYPSWYLNVSYIIVTVVLSSIVALIVSLIAFNWIEPKSLIGIVVSLFLVAITFALLGLIIANISKTKEIGLYIVLTISFIDIGFLENPTFSNRANDKWLEYLPGNAPVKMIFHSTYHSGSTWLNPLGFILVYQLILIIIYFFTSNKNLIHNFRSKNDKYNLIMIE